jgi:hypothetical protein
MYFLRFGDGFDGPVYFYDLLSQMIKMVCALGRIIH